MLNQNLELKLKLNLNLLLKNQVEILLYPSLEFENLLREESISNPFLEEISLNYPKGISFEHRERPIQIPYKKSPYEEILENIRAELDGLDVEIALEIVAQTDERGFFKGDVKSIAEKFGVSEDYVEDLREFVARLEPLGVASKNLEEFVCIQLEELYPEDRNRRREILKAISEGRVSEDMRRELSHLRISPIVPETVAYSIGKVDAVIEIDNGELIAYINDEFIELKVSEKYLELYKKAKGKTKDFLKEMLERVHLYRQIIKLRKENLKRILNRVVEVQRDFLLGEGSLKTLMVKDVAQELGISESTVSRLINSKYVKTPQGTYPLRFFFVRETVGGISQEELMRKIREIISSEDKRKPLSDEQIANILKTQGYDVARRTVAKYRESLGIPSSRQRRIKTP